MYNYRRSPRKSTLTPEQRAAKADAAFAKKVAKMEANRAKSQFYYSTAGGSYIPTKEQYEYASDMLCRGVCEADFIKAKSAEMVQIGFITKTKVHHDHIHIVNEYRRLILSGCYPVIAARKIKSFLCRVYTQSECSLKS
jgi:hypothetical protein